MLLYEMAEFGFVLCPFVSSHFLPADEGITASEDMSLCCVLSAFA